jgi:diguanylate cyclase (GGDEF)-like protein
VHTAERLRAKIAECEEFVSSDGTERRITVSIGGAVFPDNGRTEEAIFSHADSALYLAKRKGKNRVEFHSE